jgi:hypothetical protein
MEGQPANETEKAEDGELTQEDMKRVELMVDLVAFEVGMAELSFWVVA